MAKLSNRLLVGIDRSTITFLLLLCQNIVIVRPEDGYLRLPGGEGMRSYREAGETRRVVDATREEESKFQSFQIMGSIQTLKKPRFLCLHGHGSNASLFEEEIKVWPKSVIDKMELVFINGPFPLNDSTSSVNERFDWFTQDKLGTYTNFGEGIAYIEDFMVEFGPFDGVIGFSQGAIVAGALPGMQEQGVCLTRVGKIQHVVLISGAKFGGRLFPMPKLAETAYSSPINIPSLHIFGECDFARLTAPELVEAYVDPLVIYHHGGHEVPKLGEEGLKIMYEFLKKINAVI